MKNPEHKTVLSAGEQKIKQYIERIKNGASKEAIFQGLPESFKNDIEKGLADSNTQETKKSEDVIPPQYQGLDSETLDAIWTIPIYVDPEKTKEQQERKSKALAQLRGQETKQTEKQEKQIQEKIEIEDLRHKLGITERNISPEKIVEDLDFEKMSQEDFAEYLKQNLTEITKERENFTKGNEHKMNLWLKGALYSLLTVRSQKRKEALDVFIGKMQKIDNVPQEKWMPYLEKIKALKSKFDNTDYSGAWFQFNFGDRKNTESDGKRRKGYLTIPEDSVEMYANNINSIMEEANQALKAANYNGSFKISNSLKQLTNQFDSIVVHGANFDEVTKALDVLKGILVKNAIQIEAEQRGMDGQGLIDPTENTSHTDLLAQKIILGLPIKG